MASERQELVGFVDEADGVEAGAKEPQSWFDVDLDEIFAYQTFRMVRVRDRYLGFIYYGICALVFFYIIFFALMYDGKHTVQDSGFGIVVTKFSGKAFLKSGPTAMAFDAADLRYPEVEPAGAFIATRMVNMKAQSPGECVDYDHPCPCRDGAECIDGYCKDKAWCPSLGEGNVQEIAKDATMVEEIEGLEHTWLELKSGIAFPSLGNKFFVTGGSTDGENKLQRVSLKDLMTVYADPPIDFKNASKHGALIGVSFRWRCAVQYECEPVISVTRLDGGRGFVTKRQTKYRDPATGNTMRNAQMMYGLRFLVDSAGIGQRVDLAMCVTQFGSLLALLRTAYMITDYIMLSLYPSKKKRELYTKCKVIPTEDYSDLKDRINLIKENRDNVSSLMKRGQSVSLSLGPGGRGGMGSQILKRR